jgi:RNA polymerase-binding protein DksA
MISQSEANACRDRLLALRRRLGRTREQLKEEALRPAGGEASGSLSDLPFHKADLAGHDYEEEVVLGLIDNEERLIEEINEALERLGRGTFGRCERCGRPIRNERLQALPYARHCIECARKSQQGRRP